MNQQHSRFASLPRGDWRALCTAWAATEQRAFGLTAASNGDVELSLLDVIGEDYWDGGGITSASVKAALDSQKNAKNIRVLINSPGGDVAEGMAIHNLLRAHSANVRTEVIGLAASAASWIAQAGDTRIIHQPGMMMIHGAWAITRGTAEDHTRTADLLTKMNGEQLALFERRTGMSREDLTAMIADETWMGSQECCDKGFADSLAEHGTTVEPATAASIVQLAAVTDPGRTTNAFELITNTANIAGPTAASRPRAIEPTPEEIERVRDRRMAELKKAAIVMTADEAAQAEKERAIVLANQPIAKASRRAAPPFGGFKANAR